MTAEEITSILEKNLGREPSVKAGRYVGKFFNRKIGDDKATAQVVGNYGTYTVSFKTTENAVRWACSCYLGGSCHHSAALAHTFLRQPDSFVRIEKKPRKSIKNLGDLESYLRGVTLEELLQDLKARGIMQKDFADSIGMSSRHLSAIKSSEAKNRLFHELGAAKLACLWVIENVKPAKAKKIAAKRNNSR